jgi:hypothetical protein
MWHSKKPVETRLTRETGAVRAADAIFMAIIYETSFLERTGSCAVHMAVQSHRAMRIR